MTVRAPRGFGRDKVAALLEKHARWIEKRLAADAHKEELMAQVDTEALRRAAKAYFPAAVARYARIMGVAPTGVKITSAKTRFGSCSPENSLCFSLYLMAYPQAAAEAVVVHELAHIRHKNHGAQFYAEVKKVMPDYKERIKLLKNGIL